MLKIVPDPPKKKKKSKEESDFFDSFEFKKLVKELKVHLDEIDKINDQMRAQGLWADDREIVECPYCHLFEDVTFEGYHVVCRREKPSKDTGLRFDVNKSNGKVTCPQCSKSFIANLYPEIGMNFEE